MDKVVLQTIPGSMYVHSNSLWALDCISLFLIRTQHCSKSLQEIDYPNIHHFLMRTIPLLICVVLAMAIMWKKRRIHFKMVSHKYHNCMTFNQTLALAVSINLEIYFFTYLSPAVNRETAFTLEMCRSIIIDNICYKFLLPILLILQSKVTLPELWFDKVEKNQKFSMTKPSFIPRRDFIVRKINCVSPKSYQFNYILSVRKAKV